MKDMQAEVTSLQRQLKWLRLYTLFSILLIIGWILSGFINRKPDAPATGDIIRARGIIIEDSLGRDRILIGAPVPHSPDRVRTDTNLVRKHWAARLGDDAYMQWYREYYHGANGLVLLNEQGFDKLLLGDQLADPNTGKRIASPTGMLWNDDDGFERGGIGLNRLHSNGKYRNGIGLDDDQGEALHMVLLEDGSRLIRMAGTDGYTLLGATPADNPFFQSKGPFSGIRRFDSTGKMIWEQRWLPGQR
ncbi:MAG: hypothetical protein MUF29_00155 [Chitinophagaceae bacterium]|nr:hypothetical protein [Chitinophagaceae bacterium]